MMKLVSHHPLHNGPGFTFLWSLTSTLVGKGLILPFPRAFFMYTCNAGVLLKHPAGSGCSSIPVCFQNRGWSKCSVFSVNYIVLQSLSPSLLYLYMFFVCMCVCVCVCHKMHLYACLAFTFLSRSLPIHFCLAQAGSIADPTTTGHRIYNTSHTPRPAYMNNSHWWRYQNKSCCHPKNVCHCCFYRQTYWSGQRERPVNEWYDCRQTGFLLCLLLVLMWSLVWPFVLCGYCCYYCCILAFYIIVRCYGDEED